MYSIVPLAGPDMYDAESMELRPLAEIHGRALVEYVLNSRTWIQNGEVPPDHLIFVVREFEKLSELLVKLNEFFPKARYVTVDRLTRGASLSALAGISVVDGFLEPVVVDLADIIYDLDFSPTSIFSNEPDVAGIIPYFHSNDPHFSYLQMSGDTVIATVEKKVISDNASAGTYFFRDVSIFLDAVRGGITRGAEEAVNGAMFMCPVYNTLTQQGKKVRGVLVDNAEPISLRFHY